MLSIDHEETDVINQFHIQPNAYLSKKTEAYYHVPYTGMGNPGNPDYLNVLKNTFRNTSIGKLRPAARELQNVLLADLPQIYQSLGLNGVLVCVVPRAKKENAYHENQQLFRATVRTAVLQVPGFVDGTNYIRRHTSTKTTHLRKPIPDYTNDGPEPYPGITRQTCEISINVRDRNILLIDDIYTPTVNIDEDAINALLKKGGRTVTFYAVGKV